MGIAKIAFDPPPLRQMGTLGHLFGLYFFFSYGRHDIRNENIGSAFFKQWVYAMDIEFYILRHQDAVYDRVYISFRTFQQKRDDS